MWNLVNRFWRLTCVKLRVRDTVSRDLEWSHIKDINSLKEDQSCLIFKSSNDIHVNYDIVMTNAF